MLRTRNSILILILFVALSACAGTPWQWTKGNTMLAVADLTLTGLDWSQTRYIVAHPDKYYETNKILGKHPSAGQVNAYFPCYFAAKTIVSLALPNPYRLFFQGAMIGQDAYYVLHNANIGIGMKW
jgi:hypothetical protein